MFNERLKVLRENNDFKQKDIADFLQCKRSTYANWENKTIIIPLDIADRLTLFYKVSLSYILAQSSKDYIDYPVVKMNYKYLLKKLKELKEINNHSYEKIAEYIATSKSTAYKYFVGNLKIPSDKLILLSELYNIDLDVLCGKKD